MPDEFEQQLLEDIAAAELVGDGELAAEWRVQLRTYRAAQQQGQDGESPKDAG